MSTALPRTLFVGRGNGAVAWYRCALPAMALGCDWVGADGAPPKLKFRTGLLDEPSFESFFDYDVVVLQLPAGKEWLKAIRQLQAAGVTVLYEVDDWLRGIRKLASHDFKDHFHKRALEAFELCMRAADGVICSTPWLADRYRGLNANTWVCRNGIDLRRYAFTRPPRDHVGIGWAGGTGHTASAKPWVVEVGRVMNDLPNTHFTSIGQPFALWLQELFGERTLAVPFTALEVYPAAMTHFDIALAPAGKGDYFKGKSDLRWLEAAAMSMPCIADPDVYPEIEHGVTGFHAATPAEMGAILRELVADGDLRERVGRQAYEYVSEHRTVQVMAQSWAAVLNEVAGAEVKVAA
jgi:glycosyltransferase involved in cell wall biosynthesis